jgi:hypothetical protein
MRLCDDLLREIAGYLTRKEIIKNDSAIIFATYKNYVNDDYIFAAECGSLNILIWLFKHHKNILLLTDVLYKACDSGRLDIVKWIYRTSPNINAEYATYRAATHGKIKVIKWLYKHKEIQISAYFPYCVHLAAEHGYFKVVKFLYNILNRRAKKEKNDEVLKLLKNISLSSLNTAVLGGVYLHLTRKSNDKFLKIARFFYEKGYRCDKETLKIVYKSKCKDMVSFLKQKKYNPNSGIIGWCVIS